MTRVILRHQITYGGGTRPCADDERAMHAEAHHLCFIANSVKTKIEIAC